MNTLFGGTDIGLVRTSNQDCYEIARLSDTLAFAILCDGMGGENGGGVASSMALKFAGDALRRDLRENMTESSVRGVLLSAMAGANALVYEAAQKDSGLYGMGTTMILAVFAADDVYIAYVGDSRAYMISPDTERQLTKDHTVVQMLVDIGEISKDDALTHPKRHYITRAIGVSASVDVDFLVETLTKDDIVLLCSDGLYSYLTPGSFREPLARCLELGNVEPLITLAKESGGSDNITAIVAN